jgi:hypothetical protein
MSRVFAPVPPAPARFRRSGAWASAAVLVVYLVAYFPLQLAGSARRSATADEPLHLTAGYVAWQSGEFRFDPTHPPLLRLLAATALLGRVDHPVELTGIDRMDFAPWSEYIYMYSSDFLYAGGDGDALLQAARFRIMLLGALLGVLVFAWVRECMGLLPAGLALLLYTMEPNLTGHGALVTTDLGVTCFIFGAVYCVWRAQRRFSLANAAGVAAFTALAMVSKYSAVILGPILGLLLAVAVVRRTAITWRRAAAVLALAVAASVLAIWAAYGFRYAPSADPTALVRATRAPVVAREVPVLAAVGNWIDARHLLPNAYTQGFLLGQASAEALPGYLNGQVRPGGWWYYFPEAFLLKTPSVLLILGAAGLLALAWPAGAAGLRPPDWKLRRAFLLLPVGVYGAFAVASDINLGVRHILPIYPFVLLIAATAMHELLAAPSRLARGVLGVALLLGLVRFGQAWPGNLTFFNVFAGGPRNGHKFLADSNLDWGQHLKSLKQWMDEQGLRAINFAYAGTIDPAHYGIEGPCLPGSPSYAGVTAPQLPGYVAISQTILSGVYLPPETRLLYAAFNRMTPVAVPGNAIRVFWVERWPVAMPPAEAGEEVLAPYVKLGDGFLFDVERPDLAVDYYRAYLTARPADGTVLAKLGYAHLARGAPEAARPLLKRALALVTNPARMGAEIALALARFGQPEEALRLAREAVARAPDDAVVHDALGILLSVVGRAEEAFAAFSRAGQLAPDSPGIKVHLAEAARRLGR